MVISPCARNAAPLGISRCQTKQTPLHPSASKPLTSKPQLYLDEYGTFMLTLLVVVSRQPDHSAPSSRLLRLFTSNKISRRPSSFNSASYKMVFQQLLCFENDPSFMGGVRVRVATALPWGILVSFMVHLFSRGSCRPVHRTAKRSNRGSQARTISSLGQRHFQRIGRPSAGASSKGLEPGRGWHCRSHHKGPASCPRFQENFPRLRFRQPTYRNDCNKKTVLPSRSAFPF